MTARARRNGARLGLALGLWFAGTLACLAASPALAGYTDVTSSAGLSYLQFDPVDPMSCITLPSFLSCESQWMSGGAAVADVNGDGWPDLYVTRLEAPDLLFLNQGNGSFVDGSVAAGLSSFDLQSNGAAFADIDNDGDPDLVVTVLGAAADPINSRFYLFVNDGTGVFTEEAVARGTDLPSSTDRGGFSVAVGDYDRDGWVDLYFAEWATQFVSAPERPHSRLLRNLGAAAPGTFVDTTVAAGVEIDRGTTCQQTGACKSFAFAPAFVDLDGDQWPELVIAADFGTSLLFWNDGDGTFTEGTVAANFGTDENGMGSTFGDYDGDGDLDWFVTSIDDPADICATAPCNWGSTGNRLYRNDGSRVFSDVTDTAGVRAGYWGWGAGFFDSDNDADLDLVMTNGIRYALTPIEDPFNDDPMRFWRNDGTGVMSEQSAGEGLSDTASGKGLLHFDYDRDGDLDLFLVNNGVEGGLLYRNDTGNGNDWLRVRLQGTLSNRDGVGAWLELTTTPGGPTQVRQIGAATHFLGQSERVAHFGLGPGPGGTIHQLRIRWPSGVVTTHRDLTRNQELRVVEDRPIPALPAGALLLGALATIACARRIGCGRGLADASRAP